VRERGEAAAQRDSTERVAVETGQPLIWRYLRVVVSLSLLAMASGLLASWSFNTVIGRPLAFDPDSMAERLLAGLSAMVLPAVVMAGTLGILSSVRLAGSFMQARIRMAWMDRMRARIADGADTVGPTLAAAAVAGGLISLAVVFLLFGDVVDAMAARLTSDDPRLLRPLHPASREHQVYFRIVVSMLLIVFVAAWRMAERAAAVRAGAVPVGLRVAAAVVAALLFVLVQAPYKLTLQNERPVAVVSGQRCFVLGETAEDARVYCPGWNPPRVRTVSRTAAAIQTCGFEENVFAGRSGVTCQ
jgi:hypothetical protein